MANLKQRLYHTQPDSDPNGSISAHAIHSAYVMVAASEYTVTAVRSEFSLTAAETNALQAAITAKGLDVVNAASIARQEGVLDATQADASLGL